MFLQSQATLYSLLAFLVGGAFLSATYSVAPAFLVAVSACLGCLTRDARLASARSVAMRRPARVVRDGGASNWSSRALT